MWQRVNFPAPEEVASFTTSIWLYPNMLVVGVMRQTFLAPPTVWGEPAPDCIRSVENFRKAPGLLDQFQELLQAPVIFAEAECAKPRNQKLLSYLGFEQVNEVADRKLYRRSI